MDDPCRLSVWAPHTDLLHVLNIVKQVLGISWCTQADTEDRLPHSTSQLVSLRVSTLWSTTAMTYGVIYFPIASWSSWSVWSVRQGASWLVTFRGEHVITGTNAPRTLLLPGIVTAGSVSTDTDSSQPISTSHENCSKPSRSYLWRFAVIWKNEDFLFGAIFKMLVSIYISVWEVLHLQHPKWRVMMS